MFDMEVTIATQKNTLENVRRNYERLAHLIKSKFDLNKAQFILKLIYLDKDMKSQLRMPTKTIHCWTLKLIYQMQ
jgi:hypothetical protein